MATPVPTARDDRPNTSTPAIAEHIAIESADRERRSSRRETVLLMALVGLAAALVLVGLVFPALLALAVAVAVLAAILALDWLLPSGELRPTFGYHWMR